MSEADNFLDELMSEGSAREPQFPSLVANALHRRETARKQAAITQTVDEIVAEQGGRRLTTDEFDERFGHLPSDGEG